MGSAASINNLPEVLSLKDCKLIMGEQFDRYYVFTNITLLKAMLQFSSHLMVPLGRILISSQRMGRSINPF